MSDRSSGSTRVARLSPPAGGVAVRMYRQGLGDCFLLAFSGPTRSKPVHVLVDCGAHSAQKGGRDTMRRVVDDLVETTGGHLDLVVVTHEHFDHLATFVHEAPRFLREVTIGELWLAWTEDENDELARRLGDSRREAKEAIEAAYERLVEELGGVPDEIGDVPRDRRALARIAGDVEAFLGFYRTEDLPEDTAETHELTRTLGLDDPQRVTTNELALALLRDRAERVRFLKPDDGIVGIPGSTGAQAYVLGPPRDETLLRRSDPSGGVDRETFLVHRAALSSFAAALVERPGTPGELASPFGERHRVVPDETCEGPVGQVVERYRTQETWRRIDHDWLSSAEDVALHLDNHTNNTSLALAFEIGETGSGPILLFPGDAQVGNWLSWRSLEWKVGGRRMDIAELLGRTAVYKVSHHASHNATLGRDETGDGYGLRLVPEGLIALIPVDETAAGKLRGWEMPHAPLYEELLRRTRGNVLRSDDDRELTIPRLSWTAVSGVPHAKWRRSRKKKADGGPLSYDLKVEPEF